MESPQQTSEWFVPRRFAAVLGAWLLLCFPQVVTGLSTFGYLDYGQYAYPVAFYGRESFWRGELPFWNPLSNCGVPFLAQWNTLVLYPPSLFYLLFPLPWSLGMFCLLHLFFGGLGMYFLALRWTERRTAAALAGAIFAFNGLAWYGLIWPHITAALAWMPWVVLATQRAWREGGTRLITAALAGALQMLSGGAEVILQTWLLVGVLWAGESFFVKAQTESPPPKGRRLAIVGALVAGLAAAQLWPFLDLVAHSQRDTGYGNSTLGSLPLTGWANYLVPLFHCVRNPQGLYVPVDHWTGSYYVGIGVVLLALAGLWRVRTRRVWLLGWLALFGLLLALGPRGLVYPGLQKLAPWLGLMRFPIKFVVLPTFILPLLAAEGLAWLQGLSPEQRPRPWRGVQALAVVLAAAMIGIIWAACAHPLTPGEGAFTTANALVRLLFLGSTVFIIGQLLNPKPGQSARFFESGLVLLALGDIATHNSNLSPTLSPGVFEPDLVRQYFKWDQALQPGTARAMQSQAALRKLLMVGFRNLELDTQGRRLAQFFNYNLLDHVAKLDGFYSLDLKEFSDLSRALYSSTNPAPPLQDFLGVSHLSSATNLVGWDERPSHLPLITLGQQPVFAAQTDTLAIVLSDRFEPRKTVYLPLAAKDQVHATAAEGRVLNPLFRSGRVSCEIEAAAPALVVVAQTFYHPWHAYVDGRRTPLWRANYAFQALEVPTGRHQLELRYEDRAFLWGAVCSVVLLLACGVGYARLLSGPKPPASSRA